MRNVFNILIGFAAGFAFAAFVTPSRTTSRSASDICRTYYPGGAVHSEYTVDSRGQMHGELRFYWPSGRLRTIVDMVHGQTGRGTIYSDESPEPDADSDNAE